MQDPGGGGDAWLEGQLELMQEAATQIADEAPTEAGRSLSRSQRDQLRQQFCDRFRSDLVLERSPPEHAVASWLREHLGIPKLSYASDSERDDSPGTSGQQQQRQQQELRRSERPNKGRMGETYTAVHGTTMGCSSNQPQGREGRGTHTPQAARATRQPNTPAERPPPSKKGHGGERHK